MALTARRVSRWWYGGSGKLTGHLDDGDLGVEVRCDGGKIGGDLVAVVV